MHFESPPRFRARPRETYLPLARLCLGLSQPPKLASRQAMSIRREQHFLGKVCSAQNELPRGASEFRA